MREERAKLQRDGEWARADEGVPVWILGVLDEG